MPNSTKVIESTSPKIGQLKTFCEIIECILAGHRVARKAWGNADMCYLKAGVLHILRNDKEHRWIVNEGDLLGTDWFIV